VPLPQEHESEKDLNLIPHIKEPPRTGHSEQSIPRVVGFAHTNERRDHPGLYGAPLHASPAESRPVAAAQGELEVAHIGDGDEWGSREEAARHRRHSIGVHRLEIGDLIGVHRL